MFSSLYQGEKFKKYLSSQNPNFLLEKKNDVRVPFLESNIFREKEKLLTNIYWKITFSGIYNNFNSFKPETYKTGLIKSVLFGCFNLCSDFAKFHHKIIFLENTLLINNYPRDFVDKFVSNSLKVRMCENLVVSALTGKRVKGDINSNLGVSALTGKRVKGDINSNLGVSALTGKRVKGDINSVMKEHYLFYNHSSDFDDFSILASYSNDFEIT